MRTCDDIWADQDQHDYKSFKAGYEAAVANELEEGRNAIKLLSDFVSAMITNDAKRAETIIKQMVDFVEIEN